MTGKAISHYRILDKLGGGGMGVVYKAEDTKLKRLVALKFLPPELTRDEEARARFINEAQAASALDHPNICTIYEIDETEDEQIFIAMAYYEGETLKKKVSSEQLSVDSVIDIAMQVAQGLRRAHEAGIIHRDLKPANIMITNRGEIKIVDFGLAKLAGQVRLTKTGTAVGTVAYMSPEQAQGMDADQRSDIWSLGVVMYEIITGQLPFRGEYEQAVTYSILNEDPEPIINFRENMPVELERIVEMAIAKDLNERYQNVADLLSDLRALAKALETGSFKNGVSVAARKKSNAAVSLFQNLRQRRVPQILGLYILASLGVVQLVQWLANRLPISPHLPDFCFAALASMIPATVLFAYFRGKRELGGWTHFGKIGIPVNLLAAATLLFFQFKDKELGAATKTVTLKDEEGKSIERLIPKSEFRKRLGVFSFENNSGDSGLDWMRFGIQALLDADLSQDLYLDIGAQDEKFLDASLAFKIEQASGQHYGYFTHGSFAKRGDSLAVNLALYETRPARQVAATVVAREDIFQIADSLSVFLKHALEIPRYHIAATQDLPVAVIMTHSMQALEMAISADYLTLRSDYQMAAYWLERAIKEDSTFAYAYGRLQKVHTALNQGEQAEKVLLAAMRHIYRLPERSQFEIKYDYFASRDDAAKQMALLKMWVELYPQDLEAHHRLAREYHLRSQFDEAISQLKHCFELAPEDYSLLLIIGSVSQEGGLYDQALDYYKRYATLFPQEPRSFYHLGDLYKTVGKYEQAKAHFEKALLLDPEEIHSLIQLANIEVQLGNFDQGLAQYHEALKFCESPEERRAVYEELEDFHELRGQVTKSIEYNRLYQEGLPPIFALFHNYKLIFKYLGTGQTEMAWQTLETLKATLAPPLNQVLPLFSTYIYVESEDLANAEREFQLSKPVTQISGWAISGLNGARCNLEGRIHRLKKDYSRAIEILHACAEANPEWNAHGNFEIGVCYRELQKFKKAEEHLQELLKLHPMRPTVHYELALVYWEQGKKERAIEHLQTTLKVWEQADPEYKPAKKARAKLAEWQ